ncbi:MAG: HEAT repeat domain-containing protein, partial [Myxococcota bacterium]
FPLLELLRSVGTPEARKALSGLTKSKDIAVRIEARILAAGDPSAVEDELTNLLNDKSIGVRIASLRAVARHELKRVLPAVTRRINASSFSALPPEERRELFTTVIQLAPDRGEALALDVAKKGGLFTNESREASRIAAIEALGAASRSHAVAQALHQIAQSRWATSDDTRSRASAAAAQVEARAHAHAPEGNPS